MYFLGTGIGCGLVLDGQVYQGSNGLIEAGHMIVNSNQIDETDWKQRLNNHISFNRLCGCGQWGCVETFASASNTAKRYNEALLFNKSNFQQGNSQFSTIDVI